jgi:hypothetical protein
MMPRRRSLDPVDLLDLEHRDLQFAQFLLIARLVRQPAIEIELGEVEPAFDFCRRCHLTLSSSTTVRRDDFYRYP